MTLTRFTPQAIVDAFHEADAQLDVVAEQYAWFKGQRDHWKGELNFALASAKINAKGPVGKAGEVALVEVTNESLVEIPWLPGVFVSYPEIVRITEASFDLISKKWEALEKHIGILQSVNKNLLLDYGRGM